MAITVIALTATSSSLTGGSATNDCGLGFMCCLGFTFWRENGQQIQDVNLDNVIEATQMRPPKDELELPEVHARRHAEDGNQLHGHDP
jgi:glycerate kinase